MEPTLDIRVEGEAGSIPVRAFLEVLRTSLEVLDRLERAERPPLRLPGTWLITDLRASSAVATLRRTDAPHLQSHLRLLEGIGQLRGSQELPTYFSPDIAEALVKIGKQTRRPGVSGVSFQLPGTPESEPRVEQVSESVVLPQVRHRPSLEH
jgi:hypothetical protein